MQRGKKQGNQMIFASHTVFTKSCALIPLLRGATEANKLLFFPAKTIVSNTQKTTHTHKNRQTQNNLLVGAHKTLVSINLYTYSQIVRNYLFGLSHYHNIHNSINPRCKYLKSHSTCNYLTLDINQKDCSFQWKDCL